MFCFIPGHILIMFFSYLLQTRDVSSLDTLHHVTCNIFLFSFLQIFMFSQNRISFFRSIFYFYLSFSILIFIETKKKTELWTHLNIQIKIYVCINLIHYVFVPLCSFGRTLNNLSGHTSSLPRPYCCTVSWLLTGIILLSSQKKSFYFGIIFSSWVFQVTSSRS